MSVGEGPAVVRSASSDIDPRSSARLRAFSKGACGFVALLGGLVLVGWRLDIGALKSFVPGRPPMNPTTALGLIVGAGSVLARHARAEPMQRVAAVSAATVILLGLVTVVGYVVGRDLGLDQLLFHDRLGGNRIAPNTGRVEEVAKRDG